jgi:hypothetical protein
MSKKILSYLLVAMIAYSLGTLSTLQAQDESRRSASSVTPAMMEKMSKKLDKILENQKEM